jgi:hypothetical protein
MHFIKNHAKNILDTKRLDLTDHNPINGFVFCFLNKTHLIVCLWMVDIITCLKNERKITCQVRIKYSTLQYD